MNGIRDAGQAPPSSDTSNSRPSPSLTRERSRIPPGMRTARLLPHREMVAVVFMFQTPVYPDEIQQYVSCPSIRRLNPGGFREREYLCWFPFQSAGEKRRRLAWKYTLSSGSVMLSFKPGSSTMRANARDTRFLVRPSFLAAGILIPPVPVRCSVAEACPGFPGKINCFFIYIK